ncbi:hypothetical protein XVE_0575 [Xanthomonas vesicatoria ATCC 35937]|uniref:Uncharacterized protein n=1 Tax=Xanthomonas vesicatoria ATCC 35937 TaxID=925775 RepID=F0B959_9XANT|nr:hypothetical protein XVE_0575 [Xanthomonas vesicatoria ATCC 35937]
MPKRGKRPPTLLLESFVIVSMSCMFLTVADDQTAFHQAVDPCRDRSQLLDRLPPYATELAKPVALSRRDLYLRIQVGRQCKPARTAS